MFLIIFIFAIAVVKISVFLCTDFPFRTHFLISVSTAIIIIIIIDAQMVYLGLFYYLPLSENSVWKFKLPCLFWFSFFARNVLRSVEMLFWNCLYDREDSQFSCLKIDKSVLVSSKPEMLYAVNALAESTWKGCFYDMVICALVHAKLPLACASEIVAVNKTAVPEGLLCLLLQRFFSCCYNIYTRVTRLL